MGLKKKIVKSLIVWPPLVAGVGSLVGAFFSVSGGNNESAAEKIRDRNVAVALIVTAACSVGNVVYIVKS
jgi:hypothetical protein